MERLVEEIRTEYLRYQQLGEMALEQVPSDQLCVPPSAGGLSIATVVWHLSGNLQSRFTDFLNSDGEKPWRRRDEEFEPRQVNRDQLMEHWNKGWRVLFDALDELTADHLHQTVTIRRQPLTVSAALFRSLAHASYHVGQLVWMAKRACGESWRYLSVPPGQSEAYNRNPTNEKTPRA